MKIFLCLLLTASLFAVPSTAQVSESTEDWPAWQKISAGSLSALSLLATIGGIGASNADSDGGDSSESDGSDGSSDGSSDNEQKMQGYVEELKDELLAVVANTAEFVVDGATDEEALSELEKEYPLLANYYQDLIENHAVVIDEINAKLDGATVVHRLNDLMLIHFFDSSRSAYHNPNW